MRSRFAFPMQSARQPCATAASAHAKRPEVARGGAVFPTPPRSGRLVADAGPVHEWVDPRARPLPAEP
jgi:hypothetical protein